MFSNNHAKFHAFITKVKNSALFWSLTAVLKPEDASSNPTRDNEFFVDLCSVRLI